LENLLESTIRIPIIILGAVIAALIFGGLVPWVMRFMIQRFTVSVRILIYLVVAAMFSLVLNLFIKSFFAGLLFFFALIFIDFIQEEVFVK